MNISAKFGPNLFSGFIEEDDNRKILDADDDTDDDDGCKVMTKDHMAIGYSFCAS
jgi:hypothetical protein